jgi:hypothetical protein
LLPEQLHIPVQPLCGDEAKLESALGVGIAADGN